MTDLNNELIRISSKISMDIETLKKVCKDNGLDFSLIEDYIKTDLLWNSLIFYFYRDRITVNLDDPPCFNASIAGEYEVMAGLGLSNEELVSLTKNAIQSAFCNQATKEKLLNKI